MFHGQARQAQYLLYKPRREQRALAMTDCYANECPNLVDLFMQYAYKSKMLLAHTMKAFDSIRGHEQLAIVVHVIQIWPFYFTRKQNHCKTVALLVEHFVW